MLRRAANRLAALPSAALIALFAAVVALSHLTLLRLPYYWDEGGYYVPAALDFYHRWTLIPEFTNAHPPLPNVVLGLAWHLFGLHIVVTRLVACTFAGAALAAVFRIGQRLLSPAAGVALAALTASYAIWFAQSSLAHADIFAAAFTLWGFAFYFRCLAGERSNLVAIAALFSLAALSKETAIVEPAALAAFELLLLARNRASRRTQLARIAALSFPLLPLLGWYAYHRARTGFTFGNPEYLRYNAQSTFTPAHISLALRYRFIHLFFQRDIWLPLIFAAACLLLARRAGKRLRFPAAIAWAMALLVAANWIAFSMLGGAMLTRYLLPVYPLLFFACLALWHERTRIWPWLALACCAAFVSSWWLNPPISFAPEDNLTYRDMIVVHQAAAQFLDTHFPHATVLTAWPVAADLYRPDLGYASHHYDIVPVDNFSLPEVMKAAQEPGKYDTAVVFTTHYMAPALRHYLESHPNSPRHEEFDRNRDLTPAEVAHLLHGQIVWQRDDHGESAAVLRFDRQDDARLASPAR